MQPPSSAPPRAATDTEPTRRGRRAAAVVATTVGAAAVATTAYAAPSQAAPAHHSVWDRVANCESSNNWHINTGNGFYGGLQFSAGTWHAYHGHRYASQANHASRKEQIAVARRVLASQGRDAWPVCGPHAGLTRASGDATHAALAQHAHPFGHHQKHHKHKAKHAAKHHRAAKRTHHGTYRVRSGDTLSKIAHAHHVHGGWHALYRANHSRLSNPNVLRVGQVLHLP